MKPRYKTARCILYRDDRYLLAVHNRFWQRAEKRWGLPGGQIEWGESPHSAVTRELEEELQIYVSQLVQVGAWTYKRHQHMVFAAAIDEDISEYDDTELLDIGWFTEAEVARLKAGSLLHANYELEAVVRLREQLDGGRALAAG